MRQVPTFLILILWIVLGLVSPSVCQSCSCDHDNEWEDPLDRIVKVDIGSKQFLDSFGRSRFFHGTNVVTKFHPYHPNLGSPDVCNATLPSPFCDSDMNYVHDLGLNVVRLGVMWPGAEPIRNEYNCTYFCVIHGIIRDLANRGIYTLIDVHQDVLARQFCQEGVPDWFVQPDWIANESFRFPYPIAPPFTVDENGIPDPWDQCWAIGSDWFLTYFSPAVGDAFQRLYDNHDGLLDSFANYWRKIAMEFRNYSSVLGYNLLNEPWAGDIYTNPLLLIPGWADNANLFKVWEECTAKIRQVDEETLIFFEGVTWDIFDGHPSVPGGDGSKAALSYHFYAPPQIELHTTFKTRLADFERHQTSGILTEFRMWAAEGEESHERIDGNMKDTLDAADKYLQSWIGWGYRSILDRNESVARHYARTYASAVAGRVLSTGFLEDTGYFWITWETNKEISSKPSVIKFNAKFYYPHGVSVAISPANYLEWTISDDDDGVISFVYTANSVHGQNVTVEILHSPEQQFPSSSTESSAPTSTLTSTNPSTEVPEDSSSTEPPPSNTTTNGVCKFSNFNFPGGVIIITLLYILK